MRLVYREERVISAPIDAVWRVLVDLAGYPAWNPFTPRVESTLVPGDPIAMWVDLGWISVTFVERVREAAPHRLRWGADIPVHWLQRAERVQELTEVPGGTRYVTEDVIEGPAAFITWILFGRGLRRGFQNMADALVARFEG